MGEVTQNDKTDLLPGQTDTFYPDKQTPFTRTTSLPGTLLPGPLVYPEPFYPDCQ